MHWETFLVPLIALGVWLLSTLLRREEDKPKAGAVRRGNGPDRPPRRRGAMDLQRFLEEVRRRRELEERQQMPPSRPSTARPPLLRERSPQPRQTPRPAKPAVVKEEIAVALPAPPPAPSPPSPDDSSVSKTISGTDFSSAGRQAEAVPVHQARVAPVAKPVVTRPGPIVQQVRSLLSTPQTAAVAFVLREIFDRPLCKRRR